MPTARVSKGASIEAYGDAWWVPLWSLAVGCVKMLAHRCMGRTPPPPGDHKGTPLIHPTAIAPTEISIEA